jgi:REP element-mobilizing transposase RayT
VPAFKTFSARRINALRGTQGTPFWQRNHWEHVIRNDAELARVREYIVNNPARWEEDRYYRAAGGFR